MIEIYKDSNKPSHLFTGLCNSFETIHYVRIESGLVFLNRKEAVLGAMYMDKIVDKCKFNCKGNSASRMHFPAQKLFTPNPASFM
jgi:hypothetical protein